MKRLLVAILLMLFISNSVYAENLPVPQQINVKEKTYQLTVIDGYAVYGTPQDIEGNQRKQGQWRYLGYDLNGNEFTNINFPDDANSGREPWKKNWVKEPWNSFDIKTEQSIYNTDNDASKWLDSLNWGHGWTGEKLLEYLVIQSPPTEYTQGSAIGYHRTSNGKAWYQTFILEPLKKIDPQAPEVPPVDEEAPEDMPQDAEAKTNLKVQLEQVTENATVGQIVEVHGYVELEGQDNIISDIILKVDDKEVQRLQDIAISQKRDFNFALEMPEKDIIIYAEVNPERKEPVMEADWKDNISNKTMVNLEETYSNPAPKINVSITAPKTVEPKVQNNLYKDWNFTVTVTWKDLYEWERKKVRDSYTDENGVHHPAKYKKVKKAVYKDYTLNTKATGQVMLMYYPDTGAQTFENKSKNYPAKSKTVSFSGSETYTFSYPAGWLVINTKDYYDFGPGGYNAKIEATLSNGAKDTKMVYYKGIPPIESGVQLVE